jgi:hypothetical protein
MLTLALNEAEKSMMHFRALTTIDTDSTFGDDPRNSSMISQMWDPVEPDEASLSQGFLNKNSRSRW